MTMARCWLGMAVLGVTAALVSGLPFTNLDAVVLLEEQPVNSTSYVLPDRSYGQIHQDAVEAMERKHRGTPMAGKITEPLTFEKPLEDDKKQVVKKDGNSEFRVLNAVMNAASKLQEKGELPLEMEDHQLEANIDHANKELVNADKEHEKRLATIAENAIYANVSSPAYNLTYNTSFAKAQKDVGRETGVSKMMDGSKIVRNLTKLQYQYDTKPFEHTSASPSYQEALKMANKDAEEEKEVDNEASQYQALKKTGKLNPLPAIKRKVKKSRLDQAKELLASIAQQNGEQQAFEKQQNQYVNKYSESRTDFSDEKHESDITSPQAQALYEKYKAKAEKGTDFAADVAAVQAANAAGELGHNKMLYKVQAEAPTQEGVAQLVKEGDAGALALKKDMDLQAKIDAKNAKHPNRKAETLEDELKKRKLLEVSRWQAQTLLKEGEETITNDAYQLEETGSAGDLALVEANVKRVKDGRPTLSAGEANATLTIIASDRKLATEVGPAIMKIFNKNMNASNQEITDSVQEMEADATADGAVEAGMGYSGDSDELLPDSINDPMLAKDGTYGHSYDPNDFNPDEPDDSVETRAAEDETALDTDSDEEAMVTKEADQEDEIDQPTKTLIEDAEQDANYHDRIAANKMHQIAPIIPDPAAPDELDPNMPILIKKADEGTGVDF